MTPIKLIIGLGNPGQKYEQTRHNIGFMLLDELASNQGATFTNHLKWRAHVARLPAQGSGQGALLVKPQTFMNESGLSVSAALRFHKWQPEETLVIYDDASLPFEHLRFRMAGSAGGHNGIKSIIAHLGSDRFPRLKLGIGNATKNSMVGHVLGKFSCDEQNQLQNTLATAAKAVQLALTEGVQAAANTYNTRKNNPQPDKPDTPSGNTSTSET